jgi:hypothetical protein
MGKQAIKATKSNFSSVYITMQVADDVNKQRYRWTDEMISHRDNAGLNEKKIRGKLVADVASPETPVLLIIEGV